MSYLDEYRTPKACYKKAPVRRETPIERSYRRDDQVPAQGRDLEDWLIDVRFGDATMNEGLVPGKANYIKDVTNA